jgi:hypothetical protein
MRLRRCVLGSSRQRSLSGIMPLQKPQQYGGNEKAIDIRTKTQVANKVIITP